MVLEPDDVAPVEPLVPELLEVPVDPLVEGKVLDDVPDEPMPDVLPEVEPVDPVELLVDGLVLLDDGVELLELPPAAPMPDVEPDVDEPVLPVDDDDGLDEYVDDDGLVEPLAEPPAAPMPDAEPLAVPVELHAARAAEQASARINLFIRDLLFGCEPP